MLRVIGMLQDPLEPEGATYIPEFKWDAIVRGTKIRSRASDGRSIGSLRAVPEIAKPVSD